jgi:hypothetical protein
MEETTMRLALPSFVSPVPFAPAATHDFRRREDTFYDVGARPVRMLDVTR